MRGERQRCAAPAAATRSDAGAERSRGRTGGRAGDGGDESEGVAWRRIGAYTRTRGHQVRYDAVEGEDDMVLWHMHHALADEVWEAETAEDVQASERWERVGAGREGIRPRGAAEGRGRRAADGAAAKSGARGAGEGARTRGGEPSACGATERVQGVSGGGEEGGGERVGDDVSAQVSESEGRAGKRAVTSVYNCNIRLKRLR